MTAQRGLRFQAAWRLHRPAEFKLVYAQGRRLKHPYFTAAVHANALAHPRLGLSIAARTVGNAVARNRLKRILRESFRLHQQDLPSVDVVMGAKHEARAATSAVLRESLPELWQRVSAVCKT